VLILATLLFGCGPNENRDNSIDTFPTSTCKEPTVRLVYTMRLCNLDVCGYRHYLMLNEYSDACFNDYDFVSVADKYIDSVKSDLPVKGVQFIRPFEFEPVYDAQDLRPLDDNSISEIMYSDSTMHLKIREIQFVSIWVDGRQKTFSYMDFSSRERRMKYYREK
jgi:hypothetical protein